LFIHGSFPTTDADAVFFGPDSYRFCNLLARALPPCTRLVDVGCGSGVGGLYARGKAQQLVLADINPRALHFAAANAAIAGVNARVVKSDVLASIEGPVDAIIANPPYMHDAAGRTYRDGGGQLGEGLALRIVRQALDRLQPGGTLVLYTGSAIVDGDDYFKHEALALCQSAGAAAEYSELDPDVFGEELDQPAYSNVERIAAVALIARTPSYPKHTYV
jgi:release factor glutamine methyltransferase